LIDVYRKIFNLLEVHERRRFVLLMGVMVFVAMAELIGISAVLGLLSVLAAPERIPQLAGMGWIYTQAGFNSLFAFQIALAATVLVVIMAGLAAKAAGTYALIRYAEMRGYAIACRLLGAYLHQPYSWFLRRNSAEISKNILNDTSEFVGRVLTPALRILANLLLVVTILGFLLVLDPLIAPVAGLVLGGGYALLYLRLRPVLQRYGQEALAADVERFRLAQEATSGFKEVKLLGLEDSYTDRFEVPARRRARIYALSQALSELPRFALEALTFGGMLVLVLILLMRSGGDLGAIVPTLGVFAFATLRILPPLQQIYHALNSLRMGQPVLDHLHTEYTIALAEAANRPAFASPVRTIPLNQSLSLEGVSYAYPEAGRTALKEVSITIPAYSTVGIVGGTGAGKTTLVDLILGLLPCNTGQIRIDDVLLSRDTLRAWQSTIGYVPQAIYLTDDTVAANIAFGVPFKAIDRAAVERAARIAALHEFVMQELPQGYDTFVGERGVRLSGGQRQRIGIARALYRNPTLLVMDEATSALDNLTERAVMEAVANMRGDRTVILIAHRLSTVRDCDTIFLMDRGRVAASGTYDELVANNETFRRMVVGG
jgi:ATP-binding cassette, subfamily B, bacterial PglK